MQTFLGVPAVGLDAVRTGDVVVIGAPDATPYEAGKASHSQGAPAALRAATVRHAGWHGHHDFDSGELLLPDRAGHVVDAGDLACDPATPEINRRTIASAVRSILGAGAVPLVLGGRRFRADPRADGVRRAWPAVDRANRRAHRLAA